MADIVDLCKAGIRKTHIMYKGNLSYEQINRYLYELLEKELITQNLDDGTLTYRATEKGRSFLQYYNMMLSILEEGVIISDSPIAKLAWYKELILQFILKKNRKNFHHILNFWKLASRFQKFENQKNFSKNFLLKILACPDVTQINFCPDDFMFPKTQTLNTIYLTVDI